MSQFIKKLTVVSASLVLAVGVLFVGGVSVSAEPGEFPPYCNNASTADCLKPLKVKVKGKCAADNSGGLVTFNFNNKNDENAPRIITVFLDGEEFFEDNGFAEPGKSTLQFGPLPNGEWRIVVHWEDRTFADKTFNFDCVEPGTMTIAKLVRLQ